MAMRRATTKGFARTSNLLQGRIRTASESRGFAQSRVLTHWDEIAGSDFAAITRPVNVSYARGGFGATLTLLTTGSNAPIVEMQKEKLRAKVNAVYGYNAISRIKLTQTAPVGFAEGRVQFKRGTPKPVAEISPEIKRVAAETAGGIQSNDLRVALEKLAQNVLSKSKP